SVSGTTVDGTPEEFSIYTDGSKTDVGVGCAFVVYEGNEEIHCEKYKLPSYCTVFQADHLAIKLALEFAEMYGLEGTFRLYSDSLSGLMALRDLNSTTELVRNIHDILNKRTPVGIISFSTSGSSSGSS